MAGKIISLSKYASSPDSMRAKKLFSVHDAKRKKDFADFCENLGWLTRNYDKLRKKYPDMCVAVYKKKVCRADKNPYRLHEYIKNTYGNNNSVLVSFVNKDKVTYLFMALRGEMELMDNSGRVTKLFRS